MDEASVQPRTGIMATQSEMSVQCCGLLVVGGNVGLLVLGGNVDWAAVRQITTKRHHNHPPPPPRNVLKSPRIVLIALGVHVRINPAPCSGAHRRDGRSTRTCWVWWLCSSPIHESGSVIDHMETSDFANHLPVTHHASPTHPSHTVTQSTVVGDVLCRHAADGDDYTIVLTYVGAV